MRCSLLVVALLAGAGAAAGADAKVRVSFFFARGRIRAGREKRARCGDASSLTPPPSKHPQQPATPADDGTVAVTDDDLPYLSTRPPPAVPDWRHVRTRHRTPTLPSAAWTAGGDAAPAPTDDPRYAQAASPAWTAADGGDQPAPPAPKFLGGRTRITFDDSRVPGLLTPTNAAGKLFICAAAIGTTCSSAWVCSAALIGKGLVLTAAHCVWDYGQGPAFTKINGAVEVWFYPAKNGALNPYGAFRGSVVRVPAPYAAGNDTCASNAGGIVCNNDIALVALSPGGLNASAPVRAGDAVGSYFGIGVNNYGAGTPTDAGVSPGVRATFGTKASTLVAQLGYPAYIDSGSIMQVSFSPAHVWTASGGGASGTTTTKQLRQLVKATTMGGGASGGPWVVNLGTSGAAGVYGLSSVAARNVIVGVSSWGYVGSTSDISAIAMFGASTLGTNS
jgi:hypothetical protein